MYLVTHARGIAQRRHIARREYASDCMGRVHILSSFIPFCNTVLKVITLRAMPCEACIRLKTK